MTEVPGEVRDTPRARTRQRTATTSPVVRVTGLVLGFALAIAATLAVFLTDDAVYLRLAVIAVAWAFVIAAFSAGRRKTDQAVAEGRESELRQAYELELEREVAARREYELKLENQLRRETQEAMRAELDKLRADLASLAGLRDQLSGLGELRADMGRLRAELTEQLSGEMLVERIVMRTQSIRMPAERVELGPGAPRAIDGTLHDWTDADADADADADDTRADVEPAVREEPLPRVQPSTAARHTAEQPQVVLPPVTPPPAARTPHPTAPPSPPPPPPSEPSRSSAPSSAPSSPPSEPGTPLPTALWEMPAPAEEDRPHRRRAPEEPPPPPAEPLHEPDVFETAGHQRLTEILAESGAAVGGRRRRRYRDDDEDEGDDVLARVLGT
ncbi:DUF6779 domain-containing protein [Klenkia sp. LSe6-5]|uniref:DUF6779 domain-containing protein n=1 Tax=Klenkia sesuvii TaxID=3103137 RepID=A0ABU8DXE3_9ACTN